MPKPSRVQQALAGGTPKPEPEQVIKNYTEELKVPPDEDCIIYMEKLSAASGYSDMTDQGHRARGCGLPYQVQPRLPPAM
uniref:Uncharacterized protein n=1 Tax=Callithrix jacchus TaxID=9483 RepID=A0A8I3WDV9_CALJA